MYVLLKYVPLKYMYDSLKYVPLNYILLKQQIPLKYRIVIDGSQMSALGHSLHGYRSRYPRS